MDTNEYFDRMNKKLDEMSDEEFEQLLIDAGLLEDNEEHCKE